MGLSDNILNEFIKQIEKNKASSESANTDKSSSVGEKLQKRYKPTFRFDETIIKSLALSIELAKQTDQKLVSSNLFLWSLLEVCDAEYRISNKNPIYWLSKVMGVSRSALFASIRASVELEYNHDFFPNGATNNREKLVGFYGYEYMNGILNIEACRNHFLNNHSRLGHAEKCQLVDEYLSKLTEDDDFSYFDFVVGDIVLNGFSDKLRELSNSHGVTFSSSITGLISSVINTTITNRAIRPKGSLMGVIEITAFDILHFMLSLMIDFDMLKSSELGIYKLYIHANSCAKEGNLVSIFSNDGFAHLSSPNNLGNAVVYLASAYALTHKDKEFNSLTSDSGEISDESKSGKHNPSIDISDFGSSKEIDEIIYSCEPGSMEYSIFRLDVSTEKTSEITKRTPDISTIDHGFTGNTVSAVQYSVRGFAHMLYSLINYVTISKFDGKSIDTLNYIACYKEYLNAQKAYSDYRFALNKHVVANKSAREFVSYVGSEGFNLECRLESMADSLKWVPSKERLVHLTKTIKPSELQSAFYSLINSELKHVNSQVNHLNNEYFNPEREYHTCLNNGDINDVHKKFRGAYIPKRNGEVLKRQNSEFDVMTDKSADSFIIQPPSVLSVTSHRKDLFSDDIQTLLSIAINGWLVGSALEYTTNEGYSLYHLVEKYVTQSQRSIFQWEAADLFEGTNLIKDNTRTSILDIYRYPIGNSKVKTETNTSNDSLEDGTDVSADELGEASPDPVSTDEESLSEISTDTSIIDDSLIEEPDTLDGSESDNRIDFKISNYFYSHSYHEPYYTEHLGDIFVDQQIISDYVRSVDDKWPVNIQEIGKLKLFNPEHIAINHIESASMASIYSGGAITDNSPLKVTEFFNEIFKLISTCGWNLPNSVVDMIRGSSSNWCNSITRLSMNHFEDGTPAIESQLVFVSEGTHFSVCFETLRKLSEVIGIITPEYIDYLANRFPKQPLWDIDTNDLILPSHIVYDSFDADMYNNINVLSNRMEHALLDTYNLMMISNPIIASSISTFHVDDESRLWSDDIIYGEDVQNIASLLHMKSNKGLVINAPYNESLANQVCYELFNHSNRYLSGDSPNTSVPIIIDTFNLLINSKSSEDYYKNFEYILSELKETQAIIFIKNLPKSTSQSPAQNQILINTLTLLKIFMGSNDYNKDDVFRTSDVIPEIYQKVCLLMDSDTFKSVVDIDPDMRDMFVLYTPHTLTRDEVKIIRRLYTSSLYSSPSTDLLFCDGNFDSNFESWVSQIKTDIEEPQKSKLLIDAYSALAKSTGVSHWFDDSTMQRAIKSVFGCEVTKPKKYNKSNSIIDELNKLIIGQAEACKIVGDTIKRGESPLRDKNYPVASMLFAGPTGVGKTEIVKAITNGLTDYNLIRLDMSEFMEQHSVSKMIGSPPGYVGYDKGGQLTNQVMQNPKSVVLFDEIEKAHPAVFDMLLQILDDGRLTDSRGKTVDFSNTIIVMTSNIGHTHNDKAKTSLGFISSTDNSISAEKELKENRDRLMKSIKEVFRPEFINRITRIVMFNTLSKSDCTKIAVLRAKDVLDRASKLGVTCNINNKVYEMIVDAGYSDDYGARNIKRCVQKTLEYAINEVVTDTLSDYINDDFSAVINIDYIPDASNDSGVLSLDIHCEEIEINRKFSIEVNRQLGDIVTYNL